MVSFEIYICHQGHEYDRIFTENVEAYFTSSSVRCHVVELNENVFETNLRRCLKNPDAVIVGYNSQLDHSYVDGKSLVIEAVKKKIPVIQWILDHPATRWPEFNRSAAGHSAFLLNTEYEKRYFLRFCAPGANARVIGGVGPSKRSRIALVAKEAFLARPGNCLVALGFKRIGKSIEETLAEIGALEINISKTINRSVNAAKYDLENPLEMHLLESLSKYSIVLDNDKFNYCFRLMEDCVQALRRAIIFETARRYAVCVQSDDTAAPYAQGGVASFSSDVNMRSTLFKMQDYRSILSVSPINDLIHDRTMNAINAGCVPIVEDNIAHRRVFEHGKNALLFRYGDDSLDECLNIACNKPEIAWSIAQEAFARRDDPDVCNVKFRNIIEVARDQLADLRGVSGTETKERRESTISGASQAHEASDNLRTQAERRHESMQASQAQVEVIRGEAELVVEHLQNQLVEARREATEWRAAFSLIVDHPGRLPGESAADFPVESLEYRLRDRALPTIVAERVADNEFIRWLHDRDQRVVTFGQKVLELDNRIRNLRQGRDKRIQKLERDAADGLERLRELQREVARRGHRILELEQELQKHLHSLSWRVTRPLRAALAYLSPNQVSLLRRTIKRFCRH
jgi:hypothetical protein